MKPPLPVLYPTTRSAIPSPSRSPEARETGWAAPPRKAGLAAAAPVWLTAKGWLFWSQIFGPEGAAPCWDTGVAPKEEVAVQISSKMKVKQAKTDAVAEKDLLILTARTSSTLHLGFKTETGKHGHSLPRKYRETPSRLDQVQFTKIFGG